MSSSEPAAVASAVIHPKYLPFSEQQLAEHFAPIARDRGDAARHLAYYRESAQRLAEFDAGPKPTGSEARRLIRRARQIEKDERFWVVAALMAIYHSDDRVGRFAQLLAASVTQAPPIAGCSTWEELLTGDLHLFFEVNLPS